MNFAEIQSQKGGPKLLVDGHIYVKNSTGTNSIYWNCVKRKSSNCKGRIGTNLTKTEPFLITEHIHPASQTECEVAKIRSAMKSRASATLENPSRIYAEAVAAADDDTRRSLANEYTVKRSLRRTRSLTFPNQPENLADFEVDGKWATTGMGEDDQTRFLMFDNDNNAGKVVYVRGSWSWSRALSSSSLQMCLFLNFFINLIFLDF